MSGVLFAPFAERCDNQSFEFLNWRSIASVLYLMAQVSCRHRLGW